ncbi:M56 family metallopeptidase [Emticicia sp. 17c]|uniref:M56 family metallopeptidase n=1 Tax=Emticicia sp. 17c TaxID=3127704 RepID=UPI00301E26D2
MKKLFDFTTGMNLSENLSSALGWTLIHSLWQGVVIVLAFSVLRYFFKSSHARYWQGIGALGLQFVGAVATFLLVYEPAEKSLADKPKFMPLFMQNTATNLDTVSVFAAGKLSFIQQVELFLQRNLDTIVLFWVIGASILLIRLVIGFVYVQKLKVQQVNPVAQEVQALMQRLQARINLNKPIRLLESARAAVPMTIGWIKPIILLPVGIMAGLTTTQLEAVLAHELAHIKRYDYLINIFQSVVEILFFYHPATWFISAQVRDERENCCDDFAVNVCGDRLVLAKALTQVATYQHQPRLAMAFGAKRQTFMDRIKRIVGINDSKPMSYSNWAVFVGMILVVAVGIAYGQERVAKNEQQKANKLRAAQKQYDFYFFEKDKKNVGVYKNQAGEIVKVLVDGKELKGEAFTQMKDFALDFLNTKGANFAVVPGIVEQEMEDVKAQFFFNPTYVGDTSKLEVVEREMEQLGKEMEKYSQEIDKQSKLIEDKYGKVMERHDKEMELVYSKMRAPQRKIEGIAIEMQELRLSMQKLEYQYRDSKMPAEAEQKMRNFEKKERELENQMRLAEEDMHKVEAEMLAVQQKMQRLQNPMDSMHRSMERYHRPMDSLGRLMEEKGKIIEKLAREEEARFKKELGELSEILLKDGLIKDKKDFEIRLKGEKLLINLEPQPQAVYQKVWGWINKTWGSRLRNMKDKNFMIEVHGEHISISTYGEDGSINHHMGALLPPVPPVSPVSPASPLSPASPMAAPVPPVRVASHSVSAVVAPMPPTPKVYVTPLSVPKPAIAPKPPRAFFY